MSGGAFGVVRFVAFAQTVASRADAKLLQQMSHNDDQLSIVGVSVRVGPNYAPRLTMRRIYSKKHFRNDKDYRHEVANHYRDYKLQQALLGLPHNSSSGSSNSKNNTHYHHHRGGTTTQTRRRRIGHCMRLRPLAPPTVASTYAQLRVQLPIHVHYFPR